MERRTLFGTDVEAYDRGRPGYPDEAFEFLEETGALTSGAIVLEIGPGTGQATGPLLDRGARVTAVEISPELAARLEQKYAGRDLTVIVGPFEDVDLPANNDLIVAATSFHWIDTPRALQRSADLPKRDGTLAVWWNFFGDPARPDPFHDALTPILQRLAPELLDVPSAGNPKTSYAIDAEARIADFERSGRFDNIVHHRIAWTGRHRPAELRAMFASFSPWLALPTQRRVEVLDALERLAATEFGGIVERPYLTPMYVASKSR